MNISMRDKKLLLMFSGVAVFGLGWFFGYRPQMEEAANIEAANKPLEERLSNLMELAKNKDFYQRDRECPEQDQRVCSEISFRCKRRKRHRTCTEYRK